MEPTKTTISLQEYLDKTGVGGRFVIPPYQRGYVWGQNSATNENRTTNSISYMLETLQNKFKNGNQECFVQGLTVFETSIENGTDISLVDGQQRTTFFFILLKYLGYSGRLEIKYEIRNESNDFLNSISADTDCKRNIDEDFQDIYFFKKTLRIFKEKITEDKDEFLKFILGSVKFLYIKIEDPKQAINIFSMMNGNKAVMKKEELIKAEILRSASIQSGVIKEVENINIRGRLAREWDSWLYWWKDQSISKWLIHDSTRPEQLGWLLPLKMRKQDFTFDDFKKSFSSNQKFAKEYFKDLRLIQKSFEDWFCDPVIYNYIGIIGAKLKSKIFEFLLWFLDKWRSVDHSQAKIELKRYCYLCIVGCTHLEIIENQKDAVVSKIDYFNLQEPLLYLNNYEAAFFFLLLCNVEKDNKLEGNGRKFDFSICNHRSLEHIYPKSKVYHFDEDGKKLDWNDEAYKEIENSLNRADIKNSTTSATEHSIGNLVLLYGNENSAFSNKDFEGKKEIFFSDINPNFYKSRHLIHTISVFASSKWEGKNIADNQLEMLTKFENYYAEYR